MPARTWATLRNNTNRRTSLYSSRGKTSGLALQIAILCVCTWIVVFLGGAAWFLRSYGTQEGNGASSVMGVHKLLEHKGRGGLPLRQKQESEDEEAEAQKPQTGTKHIPNLLPLSEDPDAYRSPSLIFTCKRAEYLSETLDDILENIGNQCAFGCPIVVSEDGGCLCTGTRVVSPVNGFN
jgi:hypothetical protein